jgi:hypothetical protein
VGAFFDPYRQGINISAGTILAQTGSVVLSNSNGFSFGMTFSASSYIITASVGGISAAIQSISAGTTQVTSGQVVLSNSNGFVFGVNGQTITAGFQSGHYWDNKLPQNAFRASHSSTTANLSLQRISFGQPIAATEADIIMDMAVPGSTAGSYTLSIGLYSFSRSTLSTISTTSIGVTWNSGTNSTVVSIYGGQSGTRWRSIALGTWNISPGEYMLGFMASLSIVAGSTGTLNLYGSQSLDSQGLVDGSIPYFAQGYYSTGTPSLPASIQLADIAVTHSSNALARIGQPFVRLIGTGP